jgi:flagellar biosynthesis protein FlhF
LEQELGIEESPDGLGQRLLDVEPGRAVIVDTPGANPYTTSEMADLALFIASGPDIDPILVMAAGGDAREMGEVAAAFRRLGVKRLIVTRLDAARRLGGIVGAADAGLTLAQISMSPYVADALVTINPVSLSRLLLSRAEAKDAEMEAVSA